MLLRERGMRHVALGCIAIVLGCVRAPQVVAVDRATALEQQASASFPELEKKLAKTAISAQSVPLTPEQLEAIGEGPPPIVADPDATDADKLDDLLERHCVGEGNDGLLVETKSECRGRVDPEERIKLVDRTNRARNQVWSWMHEREPNVSVEDHRARWRTKHAAGITCGAWVQDAAGNWSEKKC